MGHITRKINKKIATFDVNQLKSIAKELNITNYNSKNKKELIHNILSPEHQNDLKKHLNLSWWDRYNVHVYGIISIIGVLFTLYLFFSSNPNFIEIINKDVNKKQTFDLLDDIKHSLDNYNYNYNISTSTLKEVIDFYETNNNERAKALIEKHFDVEVKDEDQYLGYIVASYFGNCDYKKAAKIVLQRNKSRKRWDFSLKLDFSKCIYYYTNSNTNMEGLQLIDSLKRSYNEPIISYLWTCIPFETMHEIETGIYTYKLYEIRDKNLKYIMDKYPDDPFIYYGYYLQGDYQKALNTKDCRIKDLCLFAYAYEIIKEIDFKYNLEKINTQFYIPHSPIKEKNDISKIKLAIEKLKEYIEFYPKNQQADDAAFWIAWLNNFIGDYYEVYYWLYYSSRLGNQDYYWKYFQYFSDKLLKTIDIPDSLMAKIYKLESTMFTDKNTIDNKMLTFRYLKTLNNDKLSDYISQNATNAISDYLCSLLNNEEIERSLFIYSDALEKSKIVSNKENEEYLEFLNFLQSPEKDFDDLSFLIWKNKELIYNRKLALSQINYALSLEGLFLDKDIQYLHYLKTRILVIINPSMVESFVNESIKQHPNSIYADDILAELVKVSLVVFNEHDKAIKYLDILLKNYPKANACDNAINELADYYFYTCYPKSNDDWRSNCEKLIELNNLIIDNYPFSSYKRSAENRTKKVKEYLGKYPL